ncbi:MAG: hypothetical protein OXI02_06510 [Candidatus Dadabacteria bacterium]|nr:hypothetical protein [Candidatus Dadabacteria bacterium]MDE0291171.1 hypothetical protein [Candidatus Dadabacteria bacterium]MDE0477693.1 hypothetical protein [Candidatus Dadabacteria bacterium]
MNSTLRYSVRKIVSETTCFVLSLELKDGHRHWVFPNAEWMDKREKAIGIEFGENDLWAFLCGQCRSAKADFSVSGRYVSNYQGSSKLSFYLDDSPLLRGDYILLSPSWGRHSKRKMWVLIPSSGRERGRQ